MSAGDPATSLPQLRESAWTTSEPTATSFVAGSTRKGDLEYKPAWKLTTLIEQQQQQQQQQQQLQQQQNSLLMKFTKFFVMLSFPSFTAKHGLE